MKKISIIIMLFVAALASCKKTPEVNLKYVDVERDLVTVGTTTANIQCDYEYIATLKKAYFYYGEGENEDNYTAAEMRVVQKTLYVELTGLKENTAYSYYYEFHNGFNSMRTTLKSFKTENEPVIPPAIMLPTVITAEITEITANSAKGGGEVTNDGGAEVTERGICWSTDANPTLNDNHLSVGSGVGTFIVVIDSLEANTTYHVRAYAINEAGTAYGLDREFMTVSGGGGEFEYVDLCLPSGTLWATRNIGANSPEEYGDYFAWGETETKPLFNMWENYKYCNGDEYSMTKYCNNPEFGNNGFTDNLILLEMDDDAATFKLGEDWCMPTKEQFLELLEYTTFTWTTQNGVAGGLYTASCGNSLFLPAGGVAGPGGIGYEGTAGYYWSNSLYTEQPCEAWGGHFRSDYSGMNNGTRDAGCSIRPVRKKETPTPPSGVPEGAINGLFTINENGDQVYFSQGNLQYQASTNTWRFAEHQWDCVEEDNSNISETYSGWIDLFGWGTSGFNHGAICYQPWSSSTVSDDYHAYGNSFNDLCDQNGQADWGYNAISNGGNVIDQWHTLTIQEWDYVINHRPTSNGIHFAKAIVNGVDGLVLLPDNWNPETYDLNSCDNSGASFAENIITAVNWNTLEANGVVFLPMTGGERAGHSMWNTSTGWYWSASHYMVNGAYVIDISIYGINIAWGENNRSLGHAVRLVQDANP